MNEPTSNQDARPWWPWLPWPAPATGAIPWFGAAPQSLTQPINPGWTFGNVITVNSVNSTAPDVEREVVSRHSYGRQLGRLMDAVAALADALPRTAADPRIRDFRELSDKIQAIKREAAPQRLERLRQELQQIQRSDPKAWAELRELLR